MIHFITISINVAVDIQINETDLFKHFGKGESFRNVALNNTQFIQYLGYVILDPDNPISSISHAYRLVYNDFGESNDPFFYI